MNIDDVATIEKYRGTPVINLNADRVIPGHTQFCKPQVAAALRALMGVAVKAG